MAAATTREQLVLPTHDLEVQERLRELNEPICLFGEDGRDRRDRLRRVLQARGLKDGVPKQQTVIFPTPNRGDEEAKLADDNSEQLTPAIEPDENKEFFSIADGEGGQLLRDVRAQIAQSSRARATARLAAEKARRAAVKTEVDEVAAAMKAFSLNEAGPDNPANQQQLQVALQSIDGPLSRRKRYLQHVGQALASQGSYIGDGRPLSACSLSARGDLLAVGSWTCNCTIWQINDGRNDNDNDGGSRDIIIKDDNEQQQQQQRPAVAGEKIVSELRGHKARITDVQWRYARQFAHHFNPDDVPASRSRRDLLVTADAEGVLLLWQPFPDLEDDDNNPTTINTSTSIAPMPFGARHADRINRVAWHPDQRALASTSHDLTWRLWDLETRQQLLEQEGHSKAVFDVAFHPDGSLACSTGEDAHVRLWDLRTGKAIAHFVGHSQQVYAASFHPEGVQLATGGADNQIRVWDLRKTVCHSIIAAHQSSVARLHYDSSGHCLISAGYDHQLRIWSANDYSRVASISAHSSKIMGLAVDGVSSPRAPRVFTSGYDRCWVSIDVNSLLSF